MAEAGDYTLYAAVAAAGSTSSFKFSVGGKDITEEISVPAASAGEDNYDEFNKVKAKIKLDAGEQVLRLTVVGSWFDIDYFNIEKGENAADSYPDVTTAVSGKVKLNTTMVSKYDVFSLDGKKVASFVAHNMDEASKLWKSGSVKGAEKAVGVCLIRNRSNGMVAKVRAAR